VSSTEGTKVPTSSVPVHRDLIRYIYFVTTVKHNLAFQIAVGSAKWSAKRDKAGASAPRVVRNTSEHTDDDVLSWFSPTNFSVRREQSIRSPPKCCIFINGHYLLNNGNRNGVRTGPALFYRIVHKFRMLYCPGVEACLVACQG